MGSSVYRGDELINALLSERKIDLLNDKIRVGFLEVEPINNKETYTVSSKNNFAEFEGNDKRINEEQFPWEEELGNIFVQEDQPRIEQNRQEGLHFENAFLNERMIEGNSEWEREEKGKVITCGGCYSEVNAIWKFCPCCGKTVKEEEISKEIKQ